MLPILLLLLTSLLSFPAPSTSYATAGQALFDKVTSPAQLSSPFVASSAARGDLSRLVDAAEAEARAAGTQPRWPDCADALCQRWRLVATTNSAGTEGLQGMARKPETGAFNVRQDWTRSSSGDDIRCNNVITVARPASAAGLQSAWLLLPPGGKSSISLQHAAEVIDNDDASGQSPLRFSIELESIMLDATRADAGAEGGDGEILTLPVKSGAPVGGLNLPLLGLRLPVPPPPPLPPLPPLPSWARGASAAAGDNLGTFSITYLDGDLRVARGEDGELRVFVREESSALLS